LLLVAPAYAASLLDRAADTAPTADDMMYCVNDPAGTPTDKKCTVGNVAKGMTATNMISACTDAQVLGGTAAGTGVECQADVDTDTTCDAGTCSITNTGTAAVLAANGANCAAGEYALGVDAAGAVESCTDAGTEIATAIATKDECSEITNCVASAWDALTDMVLTDTYLYVGNGSNDPVGVALSGDATITNLGVIEITEADALESNGANCAAGNAPLGVDAAGAVESCYDVWTEAENTSAAYAPLDSPAFTTKMTLSYATVSELVATNASGELVSLAVATYPSLTELAYVKGLTGAIMTLLGDKAPLDSPTFTTAFTAAGLVTEDALAASLVFDDGDLLDFGTLVTGATEGIMLPAHATDCTTATAEGQVCWEEDAKILYVGDGAAAVAVGPGAAVETNSLEVVATSAASNEIFVGTGADAGAYIGITACAADEKIEYTDGAPNTFTCEAIGSLIDADVSDTLTASIIDLEAGTITNIATTEIMVGVGAGDASYVALSSEATMDNTGAVTLADSVTVDAWALGDSTATTINKVTITAPASAATLTVADGKTLTATNTVDLDSFTDEYICNYEATGTKLNCDYALDAAGLCAASSVCMGGHEHAGANLTDDVFLKLAGDVATAGTYDFGEASVILEIPNDGAVTDPAVAGQVAIDTTTDQFLYYGTAQRVLSYLTNHSATVEDIAAADDGVPMGSATYARTITKVGCRCIGTCTTKAEFSFSDSAANAFTLAATPTCATTGAITYQAVTNGGGLVAGEGMLFNVTNAVSPETDWYEICWEETIVAD